MKEPRYIIRRTLSQERFEVLWTKHKNGNTTLKDLAEMDEIINRDAGVRRFVLEEMATRDFPGRDPDLDYNPAPQPAGFFGKLVFKIKSIFNSVFGDKQHRNQPDFLASWFLKSNQSSTQYLATNSKHHLSLSQHHINL